MAIVLIQVFYVLYISLKYLLIGVSAYYDGRETVFINCDYCLPVQNALYLLFSLCLIVLLVMSFVKGRVLLKNVFAVYSLVIVLALSGLIFVFFSGLYSPSFDEYVGVMTQAVLVCISLLGISEWAQARMEEE